MHASVIINEEDNVTHRPKVYSSPISPVSGMSFPYLTKSGLPLVVPDGDDNAFKDKQTIEAPPGMVGITYRGEVLAIDSDGEAQRLPVRVITEREFQRFKHLQESFTKERV